MRRLNFALAGVTGLSSFALAVGCSSSPSEPTRGANAASPDAPAASLTGGGLALQSGVESDVAMHATPEAECVLRDDSDPTQSIRVVADDLGDVSFHVRPRAPGTSASLRLECTDAAGARSVTPLSFRTVATASEASPPPVSSLAKRPVRPALTGDPASRSNEEIVALGLPPRPDRARDPAAYARWLAFVSRDTIKMPAPKRFHDGGAHPAAMGRTSEGVSSNWSGVVQSRPIAHGPYGDSLAGTPFERVSGEWTVPAVTSNSTSFTGAAIWIGLGGWYHVTEIKPLGLVRPVFTTVGDANTALMQLGTQQSTALFPWGWVTVYSAFTEFWTNDGKSDSNAQTLNLAVRPGDRIIANLDSTDGGSISIPGGTHASSYVFNETTGAWVDGDIVEPKNTVGFLGESVEWILERTPATFGLTDLASYGTATIDYTWSYDDVSTGSAAGGELVEMVNGAGASLSSPSFSPAPDQVTFTWKGFH
jgi:hypothetical protein